MFKILQKFNKRFTLWMSSPEVNAAGRIGLFRILYSIYCLWLYSHFRFSELSTIPTIQWEPIHILFWLNSPPPPYSFPVTESLLAFCLILLLVGYKTRLATALILLLSSGLIAVRHSLFMGDSVSIIPAFYIPLFMLFSPWGDTYSIDAILKERKGLPIPKPQDSSWRFFWHCRGLLIILALLFFSSGFHKILKKDWLVYPHFVGHLLVGKTVNSYLTNGFPINPISIFIGHHRSIHIPMQYGALVFETAAILIIFIPLVKSIFFRTVPLFHCFNAFFLGIPGPTFLPIYFAFPDWQYLYERFYPKWLKLNWLNKFSSSSLIVSSLLIATFVGVTWNILPITRNVFSWFQLINFHTIWVIVLMFVLIWNISFLYNWFKKIVT